MTTHIDNIRSRQLASKALHLLICILSAITAIPLVAIIVKVVASGIGGISLSFFTESAPSAYKVAHGQTGGIAAGIVGTLMMLAIASVISVPIGVMSGVYLAENRKSKVASVVSFLTDLLQGTPSIIVGIIIYACVVVPMGGYSGIAGGIALAIMMLPIISRSTEESLKIVPQTIKEASLALGVGLRPTYIKVLLPASFGGVFTGILLAMSRVIGETAPLMFTALGCNIVRLDVTKPMSSISLMIWEFWSDPSLQQLVWSASLTLLIIVLSLNIIAKRIESRWKV